MISLQHEMTYRVRTTKPLDQARCREESGTDWDDQYMRLSITFATNDERYRWLERSLFVAAGRLEGTGRIEYAAHRVT
jgi:hypothetical protein